MRVLPWPFVHQAGNSLMRMAIATSQASDRSRDMMAMSLFCFQSLMLVIGRTMLYAVGPWYVVYFATFISAWQEAYSRSHVVKIDDWVRENIFKVPMTDSLKEKQIRIWTADIVTSQTTELCVVIAFGVLADLFDSHSKNFDLGFFRSDYDQVGNAVRA